MDIREIEAGFKAMYDRDEKYAWLIELGRSLPQMDAAKKTEANKVKGCASSVWMDHAAEDGRHHFTFDSDALIVKGLLYIILAIFDGKTTDEIRATDAEGIFDSMDLSAHLSAQRLVGLSSIIDKIKKLQ